MTIRTLVSERPGDNNGYLELASVLKYWSDAGRERWFTKDSQFDLDFRARYLEHHLAAAAGRLDRWSQSASGTLALIILLDQCAQVLQRPSSCQITP